MLDETDGDYSSADMYILPPDLTLSDGDDEDEPENLNHLSEKQLACFAAPEKVVMLTLEPTTSFSLENESSSSTRKATKRSASGGKKRKRKWVKGDNASELPMIIPNCSLLTKTGYV